MKKIFLSLLATVASLGAFAQDFTITGTVTESGTGNPIANHTIIIYTDSTVLSYFGTAITDANGDYSAIIPNGGQVGPNLLIWITTDSCNSYTTHTRANMQGTVTSSVDDFVICGAGTPATCDASFTYLDSANTGLLYLMADNYDPSWTYNWDFGDGATATSGNGSWIMHYYSTPGTYYACLTITSANCTTTFCDTIVVANPANNFCVADFWWWADSTNNVVYLANNSTYTAGMTYTWDFGDGNVGTGQYPTHLYANYGTYVICLTISDGFMCNDTYCDTITFLPFQGNNNSRSGFTLNVVHTSALGVEELTSISGLNTFPNPVQEQLNINLESLSSTKAEIVVSDMLGKVILVENANLNNGSNKLNLNVSSLDAGLYILSVRDLNSNSLQSVRFVRQ